MIVRHDISNGKGYFDYTLNREPVACNHGPNAETEAEIEARLGEAIIDYAGSDEEAENLIAEAASEAENK